MKGNSFDHGVHIENIATLARFHWTDQERQCRTKSLDEILESFDKLKKWISNAENYRPTHSRSMIFSERMKLELHLT
jgi:Asp-tRNA(Asn)/Glu-tRNA(Gln) amidotransferase C subunit